MAEIARLALAERERRAIQAAVRLLKAEFPVVKVVLFGSKARGDDEEESDIDLLVLTAHPLHWRERAAICDRLYQLGLEREVVFGALIESLERWEQGVGRFLPIRSEIDRDGVVL